MTTYAVRLPTILVLCCFVLGSLSAQESVEGPAAFEIGSVEYTIGGRTRDWALEDILTIRTGQTFATRDSLEEYLADQEQILVNQRVLQTGTVAYSV